MKKSLLFVIILLSCLSASAQEKNDTLVSIAEMNWVGVTDISVWGCFHEGGAVDATLEMVDDGLAINNPHMQDEIWQPQITVIKDFSLEEGHDYIVRLTMKVPSDGTYQVYLGNWDAGYALQVPLKHGHDFQIIDVEYPEYGNNANGDGFVLIGCGWVVGTTIIKRVEILEKTSVSGIQSDKVTKDSNDDIYNFIGQKVDASYKGIVIQNGKKVMMK